MVAVSKHVRVALVVALALKASIAFAQAPSMLYISQPGQWDPTNPVAAIDWAWPGTVPAPAQASTQIDQGPPIVGSPTCDPVAGGVIWCHTMTPEIKAALDVPGLHRVTISAGTIPSATLTLRTLSNTCPYVTLAGVSQPQHVGDPPLTAYRAITNAADYAAYELRNAQLRSWGLVVKDSLNVINGVFTAAMRADCVWH